MSILNPLSWFRRRKSIGERKLVRLLHGMGWSQAANPWASNRHELVNQYRGWNYIAIHAFAEAMAEQVPQVAWVEDEGAVKEERRKAWFSTRDPWKRAKRLSRVQAKYLGGQRRKRALASIQEGDELIPCPADDRMVKVLRKPNPFDTSWTFAYRLAMWFRLAGGCYIRIVPGNDGDPAELWPIPPNWLRAMGGPGKIIDAWECRPILSGVRDENAYGWMIGAGGRETIPADEIIQIGYPHPQHIFDFYSPLEAGAAWVDCSNNIGRARVAQFQNNSYPGVVIEINPELEDPDDDEMERIKSKFKNATAGVMNRGEPIVLTQGMVVKPWSLTPVEMDFVNSDNQMRDAQLALHRTGGSIVGMAEQTTFASMLASRAHWYQGLIRPTCVFLGSIYTERLAPKFSSDDPRRRVVYFDDPTPTDAAQLNSDIQADAAIGAISPNEVRTLRGREPWPYGGDDPMAPMGTSPVPWHTGQEDDWLPVQGQEAGLEGLFGGEQEEPGTSGADTLSDLESAFGRKHERNGVH